MQREMDFTDLIDWGREADLAAVAPLPTTVLHETIRFITLCNTEGIHHFKWDEREISCAFHFQRLHLKS